MGFPVSEAYNLSTNAKANSLSITHGDGGSV